jgi:hypothetical protein
MAATPPPRLLLLVAARVAGAGRARQVGQRRARHERGDLLARGGDGADDEREVPGGGLGVGQVEAAHAEGCEAVHESRRAGAHEGARGRGRQAQQGGGAPPRRLGAPARPLSLARLLPAHEHALHLHLSTRPAASSLNSQSLSVCRFADSSPGGAVVKGAAVARVGTPRRDAWAWPAVAGASSAAARAEPAALVTVVAGRRRAAAACGGALTAAHLAGTQTPVRELTAVLIMSSLLWHGT